MVKNVLLNLERGRNLLKTRTFVVSHFHRRSLHPTRTSWFISLAQQKIDTAILLGVEWEVSYFPLKFLILIYSWEKWILHRNRPHGYTTLLRQPGGYHNSDPAQETTLSSTSYPKISNSYYLSTYYLSCALLWSISEANTDPVTGFAAPNCSYVNDLKFSMQSSAAVWKVWNLKYVLRRKRKQKSALKSAKIIFS